MSLRQRESRSSNADGCVFEHPCTRQGGRGQRREDGDDEGEGEGEGEEGDSTMTRTTQREMERS